MPASFRDLAVFFRALPNRQFANHADFQAEIVPPLAALLGYGETEVFFDRMLGQTTMRADALFAPSAFDEPWVIIEVKGPFRSDVSARLWAKWESQVDQYSATAGNVPTLLVSPLEVFAVGNRTRIRQELSGVDEHIAAALFSLLARPREGNRGPAPHPTCNAVPTTLVDDTFLLGRRILCELLEATRSAQTADEKFKSLEDLAVALLGSAESVTVKYRRLTTASSEIDLVLELLTGRLPPTLQGFGRYALVECKNWGKPVGAAIVRDFVAKLKATRSRLGLLFSSSGVTGADAGADALREIQRAFDTEDIHVAVVTEQDLERVVTQGSMIGNLDRTLDALRFNIA